ncbi:hypothetical protein MLD38_002210 [Melastoma candidum]|uniref:Uncharacterized protein n=1 Tax=Melastoma candidum TaxID=119954 RepID=A0ACB9SFM4_9MYRT|nr:hypothetical protein MLD38_002210 [Melastoma candidum]
MGISGGEIKRTSIPYEILVDLLLLLLHEHTSVLKSTSANRLLQILQGLAEKAILFTRYLEVKYKTLLEPKELLIHRNNKASEHLQERKAEMYHLSAYYICSTLCDMVANVLFMIIIHFMDGFNSTIPCFFLSLLNVVTIKVKLRTDSSLPFFLQSERSLDLGRIQAAEELFGATVLDIRGAKIVASLLLTLSLLSEGHHDS